jgi:hypothetical protein
MEVEIEREPTFMARQSGFQYRNDPERKWRYMTLEEYKNPPEYVYLAVASIIPGHTPVWHVKVNGKPKVWKRDPNKVRVAVRYGLYDFTEVYYGPNEYYQLCLPAEE